MSFLQLTKALTRSNLPVPEPTAEQNVGLLAPSVNSKALQPLPDSCKENSRSRAIASQQDARICVYPASYMGKAERKRILSSRERYREL